MRGRRGSGACGRGAGIEEGLIIIIQIIIIQIIIMVQLEERSAMFVDREKELEDLQQRYATGRPEFFVLYGRRRVGKTALLREFVEDKPHLFFTAAQVRDSDNREAFRQSLSTPCRTFP
ncbi:MAG TPA: ATP-binding protein [Bacteroidetes bacterium]|nr:ATP-binding protein [Bacteroidota bacterium]